MTSEVYVSVDIEATGPIPGPFSMLSIGAAAYTVDGKFLGSFEVNLEELPGALMDPGTQKFWDEHPTAWEISRRNTVQPDVGMQKFSDWLATLPGKPVFCAYPLGFDFTFVYWYFMNFLNQCPFSFSGLDMKTYAMALLKTPYRETVKRNYPPQLLKQTDNAHPHVAIADAKEQGEMLMNMFRMNGLESKNAEYKAK